MNEVPFFSSVRIKGGRGLTVMVQAESIEEGKKIYDQWVNFFHSK